MKKIFITFGSLILAFVMLLASSNAFAIFALESNDMFDHFTSQSTILVHADSGTTLYSKNENKKMQVASISKLMTSLLTLEKIESGQLGLEDEFLVSEHAAGMEGSQAFLDAGEKYKVKDLLKSVIVASANDSAVVLAEGISGSEKAFVSLMNNRAKELGMSNTNYANATGLSAPEQFSTALDTSKILKEVSKYKVYNEDSKIWMDKLVHASGRETELVNTNRLIKYYKNAVNGKTGYTDEAGFCLASSAEQNGLKLIAVTLNTSNASARFKENMDLFNYGFANYENKEVISKDAISNATLKVKGGKFEKVAFTVKESYSAITKKGTSSNLEVKYEFSKNVKAPIKIGDIVGRAIIVDSGKVIAEIPLISLQNNPKQKLKDAIDKIANNWAL